MVSAIRLASVATDAESAPAILQIVDARPRLNAEANRAKGCVGLWGGGPGSSPWSRSRTGPFLDPPPGTVTRSVADEGGACFGRGPTVGTGEALIARAALHLRPPLQIADAPTLPSGIETRRSFSQTSRTYT